MTEEHRKELLSVAYIKAIAGYTGMITTSRDLDYGWDGTICDTEYNPESKTYDESGFKIDYQLKSTVNIIQKNGVIKYDLNVENYNKLIKDNIPNPRILILYVIPKDESERLVVSDNNATLRKCAWWCTLRGKDKTENKETVRIDIPESQRFTPQVLEELMKQVKEGADL